MSVASTDQRAAPPSFARRLVLHPAFLAPLALAALAATTGITHPTRWLALFAALTTLRVATALRFDHWLARTLERIVALIPLALFGALYLLAFVPAHLLTRRRWHRDRARPPTWTPLAPTGDPTRSAHALATTTAGTRRPGRAWLSSIGLATIILTANYALGYGWDRWWPRVDPAVANEPPPTLINVTGAEPPPTDARADDPAMGGVPWAEDYFAELNSIRTRYWPFVMLRNERYEGTYLNGEGWTRESWSAPRTSDAERPLLSFYGGSTMFGLGQRDQFTIPSALARIAASEGYPVEVVNHGMSGFVSWQEMLLFEHFSNAGERPLRAVFYDGTNEVYAQRQPAPFRGNPIDTEVDQWQARLTGTPVASADDATTTDAGSEDGWIDRYVEHSAVHRLVDEARDAIGGEPAGAAPADDPPKALEVEQIGEAAVSVYERSRSLVEAVGDRYDVTPAFFWQPVPNWDDPSTPYPTTRERLTKPTTDISGCLADHRDVYLSDFHTNEEGAMLVAGCLWEHLGPTVRAWYRDQGIPRQERQAEALDGDEVTTALPPVELGVAAATLGPGWQADAPVPNLLTACVTERPVAAVQAGEAFARNQPDIARFTTSRITFDSAADREAAWAAMVGEEGRTCLRGDAAAALSITSPITWSEEPTAGDAAATSLRWAATAHVDSIDADTALRLLLLRTDDPTTLVAVQVIGTDAAVVDAAEVGAASALSG